MSNKMFHTASEAVASASPLAQLWTLYFGEPCDREGLMKFAECLDQDNPLTEKGCGYMIGEDGALGMTIDNGQHVQWLATVSVSAAPEQQMTITETPWQVIKSEVKTKVRNARKLFTLKGMARKVIITAVTMLVVWVGTMLWQYLCAKNGEETPFVARLFAYLTFADGGVSTNALYMIGGLLGKMFVMGTVFAVVLGGFKRTLRGLGGFVYAPFCISTKRSLAWFFTGIGVACVLYNFFTGEAKLHLSMVGVAGFLSMLWAIGGGIHFIRRMTVAMTAHVNRESKVHYENLPKAVIAMSGVAFGFLTSIALSTISWGFVPYCTGAFFLLAAIVLPFVSFPKSKGQKNQAPSESSATQTVTTAMAILLSLFMWPANAQADDWSLEFVRAENYADPMADTDFYGCFSIQTGRHFFENSDEYKDYIYDEGFEPASGMYFNCSTPPTTITKGDLVSLRLSRNGTEHVFFAYNADKEDGHATPAFGRLHLIHNFLDAEGRSEEFGGEGKRTVSYTFDDEILTDVLDPSKQAADGTEFVICFSNGEGVGETRWIYQYHPANNIAVAVVFVDEEGNIIDTEITLPSDSSDKESSDTPDNYGGLSDGEMAGAIGGTVVVVIVVVLGGGGKKPDEDLPSGTRPSDRYVKKLEDGTIEYTDPVTGEVNNRPAEEEENLREGVETVLRNPDYYRDAQDKHDQFVQDDRKRVQDEIERRKNEHEEYVKRKEAEEKAFWHKYNQAHQLKEKYLAIDDEGEGDDIYKSLRRSMVQKQGEWGAESWSEQSKADYIDSYLTATKFLKDSADTGMDMAAEYGGEEYKVVRDIYKAAAEMTQTMTDAAIRGKSLKRAALVGTLRAGITWIQYRTEGKAHFFSTVKGEAARDFVTALDEGKSLKEAWEAAKNGAKRGAKDGLIDHFTGKLTDASKAPAGTELTDAMKHTEGMKGAYGAAADDVGKIAGDNYVGGN